MFVFSKIVLQSFKLILLFFFIVLGQVFSFFDFFYFLNFIVSSCLVGQKWFENYDVSNW